MAVVERWVGARLESSSFSCERLDVRELKAREAISEPFVFEVDVVAPEDAAFDAKAALGQTATVVLHLDDREVVRRVHGIVAESIDGLPAPPGHTGHQLRIVPRLHRLTLSAGCEVFLERSILDVAREELARADLGEEDVAVRLRHVPPPREFWLQYAESDFAFVSRHLERAGIAYSFEHTSGKDALVLSDTNEAFAPATGPEIIHYAPRADERGISALEVRAAMMTARHVVHDYDPEHPKLDLRSEHVLPAPFGGETIEFGSAHLTPAEGQRLAAIRAEAHDAQRSALEGVSNVPHVEAARTIGIEGCPRWGAERLLVVWVEHRLVQPTFAHGRAEGASYQNRFRAVPVSRTYRPTHRTRWPTIAGFVHAVTDPQPPGASGRVAQLDSEGRYTVRFLFDRAGGRQRSSARLRMMQPHAGPGYGMHFPLKPGIEVLVAFIEGDPDSPVIAGSVPHPLTVSPVTQSNALMNRIQTESGIHITMKDG
jgi:type VI secretion system secreted protein VgrG